VELVKYNKETVTLAIGDGANDVSMIKSRHRAACCGAGVLDTAAITGCIASCLGLLNLSLEMPGLSFCHRGTLMLRLF